jgi:hypothetical protein
MAACFDRVPLGLPLDFLFRGIGYPLASSPDVRELGLNSASATP